MSKESMGNGVYGLAFLGTAIYYLKHAGTFGAGVWGIIKALLWPAVLMYKVFQMLHM